LRFPAESRPSRRMRYQEIAIYRLAVTGTSFSHTPLTKTRPGNPQPVDKGAIRGWCHYKPEVTISRKVSHYFQLSCTVSKVVTPRATGSTCRAPSKGKAVDPDRPRHLRSQCHSACPVAMFPGVPFPPGQQVKPGILRCQEPGSGSSRVVIPPMAQCRLACPVARFPGVPFPPGQQVKPGILRCQEPDFESLWVVIPLIAGFLAHNSDRHPAYARFARFYPGRDSG
jgi:hypothetical protein